MRRTLILLCLILIACWGAPTAPLEGQAPTIRQHEASDTGAGLLVDWPRPAADSVQAKTSGCYRTKVNCKAWSAWSCRYLTEPRLAVRGADGPPPPPPVDSTPEPPPVDSQPLPPDTVPTPPPVDTTPPPPPPVGNTHEPAGLRPIIEITFGPAKLPVGWVRAPQPGYGLTLGQAEAETSTRVTTGRSGAANDYAHRCYFPKNNTVQAGKGVGCTLYLKESDPGNTDGNTKHSYRIWYERGYVRWGNLDAAGNILGVFESASPTGLKLMGYWGVGCVGNVNSTQIIGWMAPKPRNSTGQGFPVADWTFEWRSSVCGPTDWPFYSNMMLHPGPAWHKYEVLIDAGDVGQANGQISFWYDDQLLISRSVNMRTPANPRGVTGHQWNPVQGGGCGIRDPRCGRDNAGVLDIDDVYVSVGSPID